MFSCIKEEINKCYIDKRNTETENVDTRSPLFNVFCCRARCWCPAVKEVSFTQLVFYVHFFFFFFFGFCGPPSSFFILPFAKIYALMLGILIHDCIALRQCFARTVTTHIVFWHVRVVGLKPSAECIAHGIIPHFIM